MINNQDRQYCVYQDEHQAYLEDFDQMNSNNQLAVIHMLLIQVLEKLDKFEKANR